MEPARQEFQKYLADVPFSPLRISVISNVTARPYNNNIEKTLARQITSPVEWVESVRYLLGEGVTAFEEIGPGRVLTRLVREISKEVESPVAKQLKQYPVIHEIS